jgi:hypothetical protein
MFIEFLKNNLKVVKEANPGISQADAMKIAAKNWKVAKAQTEKDVDELIGEIGKLGI